MWKFLLIFSFFPSIIWGNDYKDLPHHQGNIADITIIDSICALYDRRCSEFIICTLGVTGNRYTSVVFVKSKDEYSYWCICRPRGLYSGYDDEDDKDNLPYIYKHGNTDCSKLFNYKDRWRCGVTNREASLYFVPPLFLEKLIIYKNPCQTFYYEIDERPASYAPLKSKGTYRRIWEEIINKKIEEVTNKQ